MDSTSHGSARQGAPVRLQGGGGAPNVAAAGRTSRRHLRRRPRSRSVMVRRALVAADLVALTLAFVGRMLALGPSPGANGQVAPGRAPPVPRDPPRVADDRSLHRLYDRDETERTTPRSTRSSGLFHLVTIGAWVVFASA